jgi:hypothetical protein
MSSSDRDFEGSDDSRRKIIIGAAVIAALFIAIIFYFLMRASSGGNVEPTLEGALRPGSTEFDQNIAKVYLDPPEADEAKRALGDIVMNLQTTVRNFTGRTINGLEVRASVVDGEGKPVKQRTVVVIPAKQAELQPNGTMLVVVRLDGMKDTDHRANIKMEITGLKFK